MIKPFALSELGAEIYPEIISVSAGKAEVMYENPNFGRKFIGMLHRNEFGLWPVKTGVGMRYYSNELPAALDLYTSQAITEHEAQWVAPVLASAPKARPAYLPPTSHAPPEDGGFIYNGLH